MNNIVPFPRATGITTRQIKEAPNGSVFVCVNSFHRTYCVALSEHLGRHHDIEFVTPSYFDGGSWKGTYFKAIIVDHAAWDAMSEFEILAIEEARLYQLSFDNSK